MAKETAKKKTPAKAAKATAAKKPVAKAKATKPAAAKKVTAKSVAKKEMNDYSGPYDPNLTFDDSLQGIHTQADAGMAVCLVAYDRGLV